ncbi:hypothetical protein SLEP1_g22364 [Rubroshorea leprosula]|uniref:Uncharacterized protein n=1 Tax=Rubroshorea leprosula TaxID=152421 RepID=A0AAV5J8Y6_9ROSI|nr:hypothetical protein SLEP1_g22364 [Rubroshorea leprosula]
MGSASNPNLGSASNPAPPPSRSSLERDGEIDFDAADPKSIAKRLEELGFSHESAEQACPALTQYVHPLQVAIRQPDSRKRQPLPFLDVPFRILHEELHQLAAIWFNQTCPDPDSDPNP